MKAQILSYLLGTTSAACLITGVFFGCIGALLSLLIDSNTRDINSPGSPVQYSYFHLLKDNWKKIMASIICIIVSIRFCKDIFGLEPTMFVSFIIGLAWDTLATIIKKKTNILNP